MKLSLSKKFILMTCLVSLVSNQVAFAQAQNQPAPPVSSSAGSIYNIARMAPLSSVEGEVNAAIAKQDPASRVFLKNAGVGLLQGLASLLVLTVADQVRIKLHEQHLHMDKRLLPKLSEEAVVTLTAKQQFIYRAMDSALNQPALVASGAILTSIFKPIVKRLINQKNFQTFLASAAVGVILTFGIEGLTEMMSFSIKSAVEDVEIQSTLTQKQIGFLKLLSSPQTYTSSYMLAGLWSDDLDRQAVHKLIFKKILSRFWNDDGFRRAFYSSWMRNRLTGSSAVKLGALLLTRWAYIQTTAMISAAVVGAAGTVVEPGGGTAAGGAVGLGTGFLVGLGISTVVGLSMSRVSDYDKDTVTHYLRKGYLGLANLGNSASKGIAHQWIRHTEDDQNSADLLNHYLDMEAMQKNRERFVIHQLDLLKTAITRMDALQVDLYYAEAQHQALQQQGTWAYVKSEMAVELKSLPRMLIMQPREPLLVEIIKKDKKLIDIYKIRFEESASQVLQTYERDMKYFETLANSTSNGGLNTTALIQIEKLMEFKKFYATLFDWLRAGIDTWEIDNDYLAARQTVDRLTFWDWKEDDLKTRLLVH